MILLYKINHIIANKFGGREKMAICSYSSDTHSGSFIVLENTFINEYLPTAPAQCVKVYLYGLYLCANPSSYENTLSCICHTLEMTTTEVRDCFEYWQGEGLVLLVDSGDGDELSVKYLPVAKRSGSSKKRQDKYSEFNSKIQALLTSRMITPTEFNEYYTLIESMHLEQDALVLIADYCVKLKGANIGYPYILAVAKSFIRDGYLSAEQVKDKLDEHAEIIPELQNLTKTFDAKYTLSLDDRNLYIKWLNSYGFTHGVIKEVAKSLKGKSPSFALLDTVLTEYKNLNLLSIKEIKDYSSQKEQYLSLAKEICKNLGLYYGNYSTVVENYISEWIKMGYQESSLKEISNYCFKCSIRTLEGMGQTVAKLFKLNLISEDAVSQYITSFFSTDDNIQKLLDICKYSRTVASYDRDIYSTWTSKWNFPFEIISLVAEKASKYPQPIQQINKALSRMFDRQITSTDQAQKFLKTFSFDSSKTSQSQSKKSSLGHENERSYDQTDLDALYSKKLEDIEI